MTDPLTPAELREWRERHVNINGQHRERGPWIR